MFVVVGWLVGWLAMFVLVGWLVGWLVGYIVDDYCSPSCTLYIFIDNFSIRIKINELKLLKNQ
jgi:hypothetical protein